MWLLCSVCTERSNIPPDFRQVKFRFFELINQLDAPTWMIVGFSGSCLLSLLVVCLATPVVMPGVDHSIFQSRHVEVTAALIRANQANTTRGERWCLSLNRWPSYIAGNVLRHNFFPYRFSWMSRDFVAVYRKYCSHLVAVLAWGYQRQHLGPLYEFFNSVKCCFVFLSYERFRFHTSHCHSQWTG
jgi:hypothetical protein